MRSHNPLLSSIRATAPISASIWLAVATAGAATGPAEPEHVAPEHTHAPSLSRAFRGASQKALPSVVTIRHSTDKAEMVEEDGTAVPDERGWGSPLGEAFRGPLWRRFFEGMVLSPRGLEVSAGSDVIIDAAGIVLTNKHVVAGGGKVVVRLHDGREFEATEVKTDPRTDLAIVKIEGAKGLPAARLGDSDALEIGDWVRALGQPFGLADTVTAGIISAKDRGLGLAGRGEFLQTDAAINPGNSGGPLVNLDGEVVGISTAISTRSGGYQGVGFAVPINLARWVSEQLVKEGKVHRAYLGVAIQTLTPELTPHFGAAAKAGAAVTQVLPGSPGQEAGLHPGDVVVDFAGKPIANARELQAAVERAPIGGREELGLIRDGKKIELQVKLEEQPAHLGGRRERGARAERPAELRGLGIEVEPLTAELAARLGTREDAGVVITGVEPGSPAEAAGLEPSHVIAQVNRKPVKSLSDCRAALEGGHGEQGVLLLLLTQEGSRFVVIKAAST